MYLLGMLLLNWRIIYLYWSLSRSPYLRKNQNDGLFLFLGPNLGGCIWLVKRKQIFNLTYLEILYLNKRELMTRAALGGPLKMLGNRAKIAFLFQVKFLRIGQGSMNQPLALEYVFILRTLLNYSKYNKMHFWYDDFFVYGSSWK